MLSQLSIVLGILAGATQLLGYWLYVRRMRNRVNTGSWAIWAFGGVIDLVSYLFVSHGDWVVNILPACCAIAAIATFAYALIKKRFGRPDSVEWSFVGVDLGITGIWYFTNALTANLLYQVSNIGSFVPLARGIMRGTEHEEPLPWAVWACAYALLLGSAAIRCGCWQELAYPASHILTHFAIFAIASWKQRSAR